MLATPHNAIRIMLEVGGWPVAVDDRRRVSSTAMVQELEAELARERAARISAQADADKFRHLAAHRDESLNWAVALRSALPDELRDRAYKALLRALHPDAGGSEDLTKALNDAFRRRTRRR